MSETAPHPSRLFRFGILELDSASGELRKDGKLQPRLQEQPLQVLLMLLERPGEVVAREELRKRLWSHDTFVDFDHGLNSAINKLRDALGDTAANPRFIQTIPRRGYRFIAPVEAVDAARSPRHSTATQAAEKSDRELDGASAQESPALGPSERTQGFGSSARHSTHSTPSAVSEAAPEAPIESVLSDAQELPVIRRGVSRVLFSLIQMMYLSFYLVSLAKLHKVEALLAGAVKHPLWLLILLIITAVVGIPTRLYLLSATLLDYRGLGEKFRKLFPGVFLFDELWALAPFLIVFQIGFGLALAATAALLYVPFAQRSLLLMGYGYAGSRQRSTVRS